MKDMSFSCSNGSWKSSDVVPGQFPAGLRVLVVDDDPTCLRILEKMLKNCLYQVTKCNRAEIALKYLRDNKNGYDIVISDVHMPDMDGFKLLEHVGLEMDLPVIMMSADDSKHVVMKGVTHGACDYLIKPVRMEALKNIWQHVVRKKKQEWKEKDQEHSGSLEDSERQQKVPDDVDYSSSANDGNWKSCSKRRKEEEDDSEERDDNSTLKKPRVVWSVELHQQFVTAVNQLGIEKAVPKKILELMNVPGLSRENVASHLQKYRLYLRRLSGHPNSFMGPPDASFGPITSLDLQALAASGQLPPQSLATIQVGSALGRANQRNVFSFENPKLRFIEGQQQQANNNHQVNLLHGIPTNMDAKQLASLHQSTQSQMVQRQQWAHTLNEINGSHVTNIQSRVNHGDVLRRNGIEGVPGPSYSSASQPSARIDFSRTQSGKSGELAANSFPLVSSSSSGMPTLAPKLHEEVNSQIKVSRGFTPSYDVFNGLAQNRTHDWGLQNVGSTFDELERSNLQGGLEVPSSVVVQPGFSTNQRTGQIRMPFVNNSQNVDQRLNSNVSVTDNSMRVKSERQPDRGFHGLYPGHFGQDDLMSAILKQQHEGMAPVESEFGFDGYHLDNLPV